LRGIFPKAVSSAGSAMHDVVGASGKRHPQSEESADLPDG
jgi:hypothetical protein